MPAKVQIGEVEDRKAFHARRILLLLGGKSRSGVGAEAELRTVLAEEGCAVVNEGHTEDADPGSVIRRFAGSADAVVLAGGDGSVNEILAALVETGLPLCLIPRGTANNLARTLEIPAAARAALAPLRGGTADAINLGIANGHYFVNVAGLGLSARINSSTPSQWKKRLGPFAFVLTAFRLARNMVPFRVTVVCDGVTYRGRSVQLTVVNGKYFGNGLCLSHDHNLEDCRLSCFSLRVKHWWGALALIPSFWRGRVKESRKVMLVEGRALEITTKRRMRVDIDGDIRTYTPLRVCVAVGAIRLLRREEKPAATA